MDIFDDPAAAPVDPAQALINWKPDEVKQLLGMLQSPQTAIRPQAPPPQAPPLPPSDAMDWRELIKQIGPAIGLLAVHGNGTTNQAALAGWEHGKNIALQEQQAKKDEARQKLEKGSQLLNDVASHVSQFDNLTDYDNYIKSAEPPLVSLGIVQPGELRDRFPFDLPGAKRKEVTAQLDQLEKNGYNLDNISGGHLTLKDGTTVPIGAAMDALRRRPLDANNKPIPVPTKSDAPKNEMEQLLAAYAKDTGKDVKDLTYADRLAVKRDYEGKQDKSAPVGSDFNQFLARWAKDHGKTTDQITAADELAAKKDYGDSTKNPQLDEINLNLKQLQLENERTKQKQAAGGAYVVQPNSRDERLARQLSTGELTFGDFSRLMGSRSAQTIDRKLAIYDKAQELNPNFNPAAFEIGFKFASNPKAQQQVSAVNNVLSGVPDLLRASDAAQRSGVTVLNKFIVPGGIAIGGKPYTDFKTAQIAFADELANALGTGSSTDMSREMGFNMTDPNLSPANFRSAIENIVVPFVQRKKASILGQMGPYAGGQPDAAPAATPKTGAPKNDPLGLFK